MFKDQKILQFTTFCQGNHPIALFCNSCTCNKTAYVCSQQGCFCLTKNHNKNCTFISFNHFLQTIQSKIKKDIPQKIQIIFAKLQSLYNNLIQSLSHDRQALLNWKQNYGINQLQYHLLQKIYSNSSQFNLDGELMITGKFINKIQQTQKNSTIYDWFEAQFLWFQQDWKNVGSKLQVSLKNLGKNFSGFSSDLYSLPQKYFSNKFIKLKEKKIINLAKKRDWSDINGWIQKGKKISQLKQLKLYHKGITKIQGLSVLTNLTILRLDGNHIEKIQNLSQLTSLKKLSLSDNLIKKIQNLDNLWNLSYLALENNKIQVLENLENLKSLIQLNIIGNPLAQNAKKRKILQESSEFKNLMSKKCIILFYSN